MASSEDVRLEAAQWIERRMSPETFDEGAFNAWFEADQRHQSIYQAMSRRIMGTEMDSALYAIQRRRTTLLTSSASIIVLAIGAYLSLPLAEYYLAPKTEFSETQGKLRTITLADGSRMTLAGHAGASVRYTRHERVIVLNRGTIFVDVVRDQHRPFRVQAGDARIVNIGTSYEVSFQPRAVRVTVASGAVHFGKSSWFSKPIALKARQAAILTDDDNGAQPIADVPKENVARWRNEWAEYHGAPLSQVIADLQAFSPTPIYIQGETLKSRPVSGRIRLTDPANQIQNLAIIHEFKIEQSEEGTILSK